MPVLESILSGAGNQVIGAGMGLLLEGHNDRRQIKQQQLLQNLQIEGQKHMTDYNMSKQLQMWKDTNYKAQSEELRKAGLNPGLLYGMNGGGATTTGQASGNVTGTHAPAGGGEIIAQQQMGIQRELLQAQKENIQANTAKTKIDAAKTAGVDTQKITTEIKGIELTNEFLSKSLNDRIDIINTEANKQIAELDRAELGVTLDRTTLIQKAELIKAQAVGEILKNALIQAQTAHTRQSIEQSKAAVEQMSAQIKQRAEEITQGWEKLDQADREIKLKAWEAELRAEFPGIMQVIGKQANNVTEGIRTLLNSNTRTYNAPDKVKGKQ